MNMHRAISSSKRTVLVIAISLIFCGLSFLHDGVVQARDITSARRVNPIQRELTREASRPSPQEEGKSIKDLSDRLDASHKKLDLLESFPKTNLNPDVLRTMKRILDELSGATPNAYAGSKLEQIQVSRAPAKARQKREDLTQVVDRYSETIDLMRYENAELREQIAWIRFKDAAGRVEASPESRQEQQNTALKLYEVWRLSKERLERAEKQYEGLLRLDMPGPQIDAANKRLEMAKIFMRFGYELLDSGKSDGQTMMRYARVVTNDASKRFNQISEQQEESYQSELSELQSISEAINLRSLSGTDSRDEDRSTSTRRWNHRPPTPDLNGQLAPLDSYPRFDNLPVPAFFVEHRAGRCDRDSERCYRQHPPFRRIIRRDGIYA